MRLTLITPPAAEPFSFDEVARHLRILDDSYTDASIVDALVLAARQALDGRDGLLGRALIQQTWRLSIPCFAATIEIPLPPLMSVDQIVYLDSGGVSQTIDLQAIIVEGTGDSDPASIRPVSGASWPSTAEHPEAVQITFTAGYAPVTVHENGPAKVISDLVPAPLKQAMLLHIASMYEHRESVTIASGFMAVTPHGYDDLIAPYRLRGF